MPLHADKEGWHLIKTMKHGLVDKLLNLAHSKAKKDVEKRKQEGWRRNNTEQVRHVLFDSIGESFANNNKWLIQSIDIFSVVYDSDDAYATMFHNFVNKCNNGELEFEANDPDIELPEYGEGRVEKEYEEHYINMKEQEKENAIKKDKHKT